MKSTRFDRLLASTAVALVLALSSHAAIAQQTEKSIQTAVPMPDTTLPPPLTAKDVQAPTKQAAPITKDEPTKTGTVTTAAPIATADSGMADKLRELINSKQFERLITHKTDRTGVEGYYGAHGYAPLWVTRQFPGFSNPSARTAIASVRSLRCSAVVRRLWHFR